MTPQEAIVKLELAMHDHVDGCEGVPDEDGDCYCGALIPNAEIDRVIEWLKMLKPNTGNVIVNIEGIE